MKTFEFTEQEIKDLRKAINFYADYVYLEDGPYERAKALANKIAPKKVTKEGWVIVFSNGLTGGVYETEAGAEEALNDDNRRALLPTTGHIVKVTWEQEE